MLIVNNKALKITNKWLNPIAGSGPTPGPTPPGPSIDEVTIGTQTWTSKNLAIDDGGEGIVAQTVNYGNGNITEYYYTWDAAVRVASSISGWHLPSKSEWTTLASNVNNSANAIKSTYGWLFGNGTDVYEFTALPAGYLNDQQTAYYFGEMARLWTSTEFNSSTGSFIGLDDSDGISGTGDTWQVTSKSYYCSVRLVKDAT